MKNISNEIIVEQIQRMKQNLTPALIVSLIAIILCVVGGTYIMKSKIGSHSFIESFHILSTSLLPMLTILFIGFLTFIICLLLED